MTKRLTSSLLILAGVLLAASPAFAEKPEKPEKPKASAAPAAAAQPAETAAGGSAEMKEAIQQAAPYEEGGAFGEAYLEEQSQEAFLRLAEDFIYTTEIGTRSVGSVPVWPRGALKLGPLYVFPYLLGQLSWTNNVFDQENDRSSWYFTEGGGFTGQYPFLGGKGNVSFGADYRHLDYLNRDLSYSEWVLGAGLGYRFAMGLWMKGGVKWERLVDPIGIEFAGKLRRDQFSPYFDMGMDNVLGNKFNVEAGFDAHTADFDGREFKTGEYVEYDAHLKVSYPFVKNTSRVYVRYDYIWRDADSSRINDLSGGHALNAGIEGKIPLTESERLLGFLEVGYRRDLFDSPRTLRIGSARIGTDDDRRRGGIVGGVGLRYLVGPRTSAELRLNRNLQFSTRSNYQMNERVDLGVTHNLLDRVVTRVGAYLEHSDPSQGASMSRWGVGAGARYVLMDQIDLDLALDYGRRNTSREGYDSDTFTGTFGVTVYFR